MDNRDGFRQSRKAVHDISGQASHSYRASSSRGDETMKRETQTCGPDRARSIWTIYKRRKNVRPNHLEGQYAEMSGC